MRIRRAMGAPPDPPEVMEFGRFRVALARRELLVFVPPLQDSSGRLRPAQRLASDGSVR